MELIFIADNAPGSSAIRVRGEVTEFTLQNSKGSVGQIIISLKLDELCVIESEDVTRIIPIPKVSETSSGHLRICGATKYSVDMNILTVVFNIRGIYTTKELACAAEMEDMIRKTTGASSEKAMGGATNATRGFSSVTLPKGFENIDI